MPSLKRTLSLRDLIVYGLLFIGPLAPVGCLRRPRRPRQRRRRVGVCVRDHPDVPPHMVLLADVARGPARRLCVRLRQRRTEMQRQQLGLVGVSRHDRLCSSQNLRRHCSMPLSHMRREFTGTRNRSANSR